MRVRAWVGPGLAIALAVSTHARATVWQSNVSLWADAIDRHPADCRARINYAAALIEADDDGMIDAAQQAMRICAASHGRDDLVYGGQWAGLVLARAQLAKGSQTDAWQTLKTLQATSIGARQLCARWGWAC